MSTDELLTDAQASQIMAADLLNHIIANRNAPADDIHAPWGGLFPNKRNAPLLIVEAPDQC